MNNNRYIKMDYLLDERKFRIRFNGLEIGDQNYGYFSLKGEFSTEKESREDASRFMNVLGILKSMEKGEYTEIVLGEGLKKYGGLFKNSYEYGMGFLKKAVGDNYKIWRRTENVAENALKNVLEEYPELGEFRNIIRYHAKQMAEERKGKTRISNPDPSTVS